MPSMLMKYFPNFGTMKHGLFLKMILPAKKFLNLYKNQISLGMGLLQILPMQSTVVDFSSRIGIMAQEVAGVILILISGM